MGYAASVFTYICISMICVMGTFLLTGLTGLFSLGQAAMMGMGAYTAGLLSVRLGFPPIIASLIALAVCALMALIIGYVALKVRQDHFAIATLGFCEGMKALLNWANNLTGGSNGLRGIPTVVQWWTAPALLILIIILIIKLKCSDFGRRCRAVRDNQLAVEVLGVPIFRHKMIVFMISSVIMGLGGCLYAFYQGYINPDITSWLTSAEWIIIIFVGGRDSITGALFTGVVLMALPEVLRFADEWRTIIYCIIVILMISFRPSGLFGKHELSITGIIHRIKMLSGRLNLKKGGARNV